MTDRSRNIRVPQYLLLDVDNSGRSNCKEIFETIIPNIVRPNITDKDFIESLFGYKFNPAYLTYSVSNESLSLIQSKLCSNSSNEWILFTILEKETLKKSINENTYAMEIASDGYKETSCNSLDFKTCSLSNLENDFPRLFQFDHEQHIKKIRTHKRGIPIEIVYIVYHYIRRKAIDFIQYKDKLTRINSALFNITIISDLITFDNIRIKIEIIQKNNVLFPDMDCLATAQRKAYTQTRIFQLNNPIIYFDRLVPSTKYNICASCHGTDKVCKQIKTSNMKSSFSIQRGESIVLVTFNYGTLVILTLFILFLIILIHVSFFHHPTSRSDQNRTNETNTNEDEISVDISLQTADAISISTMTGESVQEPRGSISTVGSMY